MCVFVCVSPLSGLQADVNLLLTQITRMNFLGFLLTETNCPITCNISFGPIESQLALLEYNIHSTHGEEAYQKETVE